MSVSVCLSVSRCVPCLGACLERKGRDTHTNTENGSCFDLYCIGILNVSGLRSFRIGTIKYSLQNLWKSTHK